MNTTPERDLINEARKQWVRHGWTEAADGMALVTSIVRVQQLLMERLDVLLRPLDLSFARYEILMVLSFSSAGAMPMTRLGSVLQVHPSSITSAAQRLQEQGFLERSRLERDRRVVLASITGAGRVIAREATAQLNEHVFGKVGLDDQESAQLMALLDLVRARSGDTVVDTR